MTQILDVKVPNIGDFDSVPVIELLVADGDTVDKDQPLLVLESDKATMEVPSPGAGTVRNLKVKVGDTVAEGHAVCQLETDAEAPSDEPRATAPDPAPAEATGKGETKTQRAESPAPVVAKAADPEAPDDGDREPGEVQVVTVPHLGDFDAVPLIEILVAEGDTVAKDQALVVLESDKATMEVPSPAAGVVVGLRVKVGDSVGEGSDVLELRTAAPVKASGQSDGGNAAGPETVPAANASAAVSPKNETPAAPDSGGKSDAALPDGRQFYAGPAVRKVARQYGVDLSRVSGSGNRGRILIEDVQAHVRARLSEPAGRAAEGSGGSGIPPIPEQDFSRYGEIETQPLARIRKLSAAHLTRAWLNVPHVTQHDDADITELEAFRKSAAGLTEAKLTLLPFLIKAVSLVLKQLPEFNSSLTADGQSLVLKHYCHIGFAADTPNGLVVPVIRDVWGKSVGTLAADCARLAAAARDGKLKPDEMRGGCFSISSLGGIGGGHFTPIVNAPEVAILGASRAQTKPVWDGETFAPRLMLPLSLSYDHRVIDGAAAARFVVALSALLGDVRRWVL
jgi:pyruvate dehydrogenase E2 component (dihydrolipoamide acetyltransferase)